MNYKQALSCAKGDKVKIKLTGEYVVIEQICIDREKHEVYFVCSDKQTHYHTTVLR